MHYVEINTYEELILQILVDAKAKGRITMSDVLIFHTWFEFFYTL